MDQSSPGSIDSPLSLNVILLEEGLGHWGAILF
jgi:hypothetical protein